MYVQTDTEKNKCKTLHQHADTHGEDTQLHSDSIYIMKAFASWLHNPPLLFLCPNQPGNLSELEHLFFLFFSQTMCTCFKASDYNKCMHTLVCTYQHSHIFQREIPIFQKKSALFPCQALSLYKLLMSFSSKWEGRSKNISY